MDHVCNYKQSICAVGLATWSTVAIAIAQKERYERFICAIAEMDHSEILNNVFTLKYSKILQKCFGGDSSTAGTQEREYRVKWH